MQFPATVLQLSKGNVSFDKAKQFYKKSKYNFAILTIQKLNTFTDNAN